jgi:excisionase family DNA binding protein
MSTSTEPLARRAYTIKEAAEILGLSEPTLFRRIEDGTIRSVKIGAARRIPTTVIDALLGEAS